MINRGKKREMNGIPTSSLSDIAFCLLVFFLSTTTFDIKKGLGLMLPAPSKADNQRVKLKNDNLTKIYVDPAGKVFLNGEEIAVNKINREIKKTVAENPDMVFSLKTDRKSRYKFMIQVLDQLRLGGAEKISLGTN
ncbi:MAG: biopolymer transporter ExbD [Candidatus Cloacimonadota bacterium]|nr:MAG: biopolymer transporter ExbD [Candidatus Cloacimonadota bacterium]